MARKEIRLHNLRVLIDEYGTISALAEATGTSEKYISQLLHETPLPSGRSRAMGDALAEKIEAGCRKPKGWIDFDRRSAQPHEDGPLTAQEAELLRLFKAADKAQRRAIMAVARLDCLKK
ncbi:MAG: hypothetical protein PHD19_09490 [Dechloromonas sp.]|nr:hypothetical protein [Dechloromonas sp.]